MSRLIFIKFLEDKGLVERNLLQRLLKEYRNVKIPATFYKTYLQPLFYDVFNTPPDRRKSNVNNIIFFKEIPYLNGGLFREVVPKEKESDVDNEIIEVIIKKLLEKYSFTLNGKNEEEGSLNPDILGNVFEKTINYLTGKDENDKRKELGAYYTPEEVTSFISKNTIHPVIFEKIKIILKRFGWTDANINSYESLTDFLDNTPKSNPKVLKTIYDEINGIKILDPACGSGHFLTSAMKELIFIKKKLQENLEKESVYTIKRQIISNNLHGVDIEGSAIEIAKLRLWLSLIENLDVSDISHLETLPNIEYKIIDGNSLIGWVNEGINQNVAITPYDDRIRGIFEGLKIAYVYKTEKFKLLSESEELLSTRGGRLVDNLKRAYSNLQILYSQEDGEKAVKLREILVTIRNAVYTVISPSFQKYNIDKSNSTKKNKKETVEKYNVSNQFHWNIDFGNIISSGGFDIIIENPPYGIKIKENERLYIPQSLPCTNEYVNSALAFIERSYYLAKDGGYIGLIVPKSLAYSQKWEIGRKLIKNDLDTIVDVSRAFKDVKLEQVIIIIKKGSASKNYKIKDIKDVTSFVIDKNYIDLTDTLIIHANKNDLEIFKKLNTSREFLGKISKTCRGLPFQKEVTNTKTRYPVYCGRDISKYNINDASKYLPSDLVDVENEKIKLLMQSKVLSQRIVAHVQNPVPHIIIMSVLDKKGILSLDTVENTILIDNDYSVEFITCLLNSRLISWYSYRYIFAKAIRTMDLDEYYINKIPLPKKSKKLDKFKTLYNELEKAQKQQDNFKVAKIDYEINSLIYALYDLNETEIYSIESDFIQERSNKDRNWSFFP